MTGRIAESEKTSFVHSEAGVAMGSLVQGRNCHEAIGSASWCDWGFRKHGCVSQLPIHVQIRCRRGKDGVSAPGKLREIRTRWGTIRKESEVHAKANDGGKHTEPHIHARTTLPHIHPSFQAGNPHLTHPLRHAKPSYSAPRPSEAPTIQRNNAYARTVFGNAIGGACSRSGLRRRERGSIMRPTFVEVLQKAQTRFVCPRFRQLWNVPKYPSSEGLGGFFGYTESRDRYLV
ncbi:hypothetical protein DFP72DRAFT_845247 [Ephemerocybe angulata]|uniref:Uncharacterized protein n=1 Tax=Ephemerocybe angulata TaxID=980116 RepID=A0A8H6MAS8_9AGAR|nr:hypothetical protein DFP72DRAFT_845247 [Tulosesus angulatus]